MEPEAAFGGARRSLDEAPGKNLDGLLSLSPFPAGGPCRNAALAGAGGTSSPPAHGPSGYAPLDGPLPPFGSGEPSLAKQCIPCPAVSQTPSASSTSPFPYGCLGGGCYSYRVARSALKPCPAPPQAAYTAEKYLEVCGAAASAPPAPEDYTTRPAEFAFYPGYAGPYQSMTSYLDVSLVQTLGGPQGDPRHETLLPVDPYHDSWALSGGWNNQVCCPKEPNPPGPFWKTAFTDAVSQSPPEGSTFRRGRKKRIPYSKGQLKELEKEYSNSKFITKDKRRKISAATNLSERQITIWFQNRRVKEKKVVAKVKCAPASGSSGGGDDAS
ncbi:homeobox protein Hox-B13 [Erythrolamprus reginae]|uniref:homeobox protein Hox-B13 n=1 Tax=Erythrolamprus reginae TaxID=121349 RepID=UPI00396CB994